jgi:hypothetical protein
MPEQKIILSVIGQVLAGTEDNQLLKFIGMVNQELSSIIDEFTPKEYAPEITNDFTPIEDLPRIPDALRIS